jgi:hypothetical protein
MTRRTSETGAFSAPRMRTPRGPSRTLWSLHRTVSTSDTPVVTRRHARIGFHRIRPMRCPSKTRPCGRVEEGLNLRARGLCFDPPVRASRAKAQERLPSYREAASFYTCSPRVMETFGSPSRTRTVSPSTHPRPASAVLRTSFWLAPSRHQQVLRPPGEEDARCVRPTSATQSNCVHPYLACSQIHMLLAQRGHPTEDKAPCGISGGRGVSRHPRTLRRIVKQR